MKTPDKNLNKKKTNQETNNPKYDITKIAQFSIAACTIVLAIIGWYQACTVKESMEISNKAYISLTEPTINPDHPSRFSYNTATIKIINTGNSPAYNVKAAAKYIISKKDSIINPKFTESDFLTRATVLGSNVELPISASMSISKTIPGTDTAFFFGKITFKDIFDCDRFIEFCFYYNGTMNRMVFCEYLNKANKCD